MQSTNEINGPELVKLFKHLKEEGTLLKMTFIDRGDEILTYVTGVRQQNKKAHFRVDAPVGFVRRAMSDQDGRILFEFDGDDRVPFSFRTVVEKPFRKEVWIRFPEFVERVQRRRHFRLKPPSGVSMVLIVDGTHYETVVIDISVGGALIGQSVKFQERYEFCEGDCLDNVRLRYPQESETMQLAIKKALIKRINKKPGGAGFDYAIQFVDVGKEEEKALNEFIYRCQRNLLKSRQLFSED